MTKKAKCASHQNLIRRKMKQLKKIFFADISKTETQFDK